MDNGKEPEYVNGRQCKLIRLMQLMIVLAGDENRERLEMSMKKWSGLGKTLHSSVVNHSTPANHCDTHRDAPPRVTGIRVSERNPTHRSFPDTSKQPFCWCNVIAHME